jgi:hypothetical protein
LVAILEFQYSSKTFNSPRFYNYNVEKMGYAHFFNSKIAIEASLFYSYYINLKSSNNNNETGDIKWNSTQNQLYFSVGFQMFW